MSIRKHYLLENFKISSSKQAKQYPPLSCLNPKGPRKLTICNNKKVLLEVFVREKLVR